jgi:hypothetical protein
VCLCVCVCSQVQDAQRHTLLSRNIWNAAFGSDTASRNKKRSRSPTLYVNWFYMYGEYV